MGEGRRMNTRVQKALLNHFRLPRPELCYSSGRLFMVIGWLGKSPFAYSLLQNVSSRRRLLFCHRSGVERQ